jgi:hypothetical protein
LEDGDAVDGGGAMYSKIVVEQLKKDLNWPYVPKRPRKLTQWAKGYLATFVLVLIAILDVLEGFARLVMFWKVSDDYLLPFSPIRNRLFSLAVHLIE